MTTWLKHSSSLHSLDELYSMIRLIAHDFYQISLYVSRVILGT